MSRPELVLVVLGLGADRAWAPTRGELAHPRRGTLQVQGGLEVEAWTSVLVEGSIYGGDTRLAVAVACEAELGMAPARLALALRGLRAELWLRWPDGRADLLLEGRLHQARVEPHRFEVGLRGASLDEVAGVLLDTGAVVGPATWPRTDAERVAQGDPAFSSGATVARDPEIEGQAYPVIIGAPAVDVPLQALGGGLTGSLPCAPQLLVEASDAVLGITDHVLVIASPPIAATTVRRVARDANGAALVEDVPVVTRQDRQGRLCSVCSPGSALAIPQEGGTEAWTVLPGPAGSGLGMRSPYSAGPLRRAGEVLRWALERSGAPLDPAGVVVPSLDAYLIDVAVWEQVRAVDWAAGLLRWLPADLLRGPRGLRLVPRTRLRGLHPSAARWSWTVGAGVARVEAPLADAGSPPTRLSLGYAVDARAGRSTRWVHVCPPGDPLLGSDGAVASPLVADAPVLPGRLPVVEVLDGAPTSDQATATRMALDAAEARLPAWSARYAVGVDTSSPLSTPRAGDLVHLVDDELGWDVLAQVVSVEYAGGVITAGLRWPG